MTALFHFFCFFSRIFASFFSLFLFRFCTCTFSLILFNDYFYAVKKLPVFDLLRKWYIFKRGRFISLQNWLPCSVLLHVSEFCVNILDNKTNKYMNSGLTVGVSFSVVHTCGWFVLQSRDVFLVMCSGILFRSKLMVC